MWTYIIISAIAILAIIQIWGMVAAWRGGVRELTDDPWWWRLGLLILWPVTLLIQGIGSVE